MNRIRMKPKSETRSAPSPRRAILCARLLVGFASLWLPLGSPAWTALHDAPPAEGTAEPAEPTAQADTLAEARRLTSAGRYAEAADLVAPLIDDGDEPDAELAAFYGELLVAARRFDKAIAVLERLRARAPERPRLAYQLGTAYAAVGRLEDALAAFAAELERNPDPAVRRMAWINRSLLLQKLERWAEAADALEEALALAVESPEMYGELTRLYLEARAPQRAVEALARASEHGYASAALYFNTGAQFFNTGEYEQAAAMFEKALELDSALAEAERSLGWTLVRLGRREEARRHLERYLELRPAAADRQQIEAQLAELRSS